MPRLEQAYGVHQAGPGEGRLAGHSTDIDILLCALGSFWRRWSQKTAVIWLKSTLSKPEVAEDEAQPPGVGSQGQATLHFSAGGRQNAQEPPHFLSTPQPVTVVDFPLSLGYIVWQLTFRKGDYPAGLASSPETHLGLEVRDRKSGVKLRRI